MAYIPTVWKDRIVENPKRYTKANETGTSVELTADPGAVTEAGTPISAANLNKIENALASVVNATGIGLGANLNSYTNEGEFFCGQNTVAETLLNCPTTLAFYLKVSKHAGVNQMLIEYINISSFRIFTRNEYLDIWSPWQQVYHSGNTFKTAGNTMIRGTQDPAISLAIGDADTGFDWTSDGHFGIFANAVRVAFVQPDTFDVQVPLRQSGHNVLTDISPSARFFWQNVGPGGGPRISIDAAGNNAQVAYADSAGAANQIIDFFKFRVTGSSPNLTATADFSGDVIFLNEYSIFTDPALFAGKRIYFEVIASCTPGSAAQINLWANNVWGTQAQINFSGSGGVARYRTEVTSYFNANYLNKDLSTAFAVNNGGTIFINNTRLVILD